MSLAEEIGKLYELHKAGILSAEEFTQAKGAAIHRFSARSEMGTAPGPLPPASTPPPAAPGAVAAASATDSANAPALRGPQEVLQREQPAQPGQESGQANEEEEDARRSKTPPALLYPLLEQILQEEILSVERLFPLVNTAPLLRYSSVSVWHSTLRFLTAVDHLTRICTNLLTNPMNPKFHQLRLGNPKLSAEVFAIDGTLAFLQSIGFDLVQEGSATTAGSTAATEGMNVDHGRDGRCLRWRAGEQSALLPRLEQATTALSFLREREEGIARHRIDLQRLHHSLLQKDRGIALDIRLEQARAALNAGKLTEHLVQLYNKDDAGDGLYSAATHAQVLARLLRTTVSIAQDAQQGMHDARSALWLPLDNPTVFAAVVQQLGSLELLVVLAGATLRTLPSLPSVPSSVDGPAHSQLAPPSMSLLGEDSPPIGLAFPIDLVKLESAATVADAVSAAVQLTRQAQENEARQAAEAAIRADRRRERLRQVHISEATEARVREEIQAARAGRRQRRDGKATRKSQANKEALGGDDAASASLSDDSSSSLPDSLQEGEVSRESGHPRGRGVDGAERKRVPIAEAVAFLLGKTKREDDW